MLTESIIQWNIQGISSHKDDLLHLISIYRPMVIAIQETFLGNDFMVRVNNYNGLCKQGHYNRRYHGGVAIYIHDTCPFQPIEIQSQFQVVAARVQLPRSCCLTIASIYIPSRNTLNRQDMVNIVNQLPAPFLVLGDVNAHNTIWGGTQIDARGRIIEEFINEYRLNCLNDGSATHVSGTSIDVSLMSPEVSADFTWEALTTVLSSDHYPIVLSYHCREQPIDYPTAQYNYKRGKWSDYEKDVVWRDLPVDVDHLSPDDLTSDLYDRFYSAADRHVPKFTQRRFFPKPWWNLECKTAYLQREKSYRTYKIFPTMQNKINWKRNRAIATYTFRTSKQDDMRKYLDKMTANTPMAEIYEKIRKIRGRTARKVHILRTGNETLTNEEDIAEALAEALANISSNNNYSPRFNTIRQAQETIPINFSSNDDEEYNQLFSMHELQHALKSVSDTSPGPDKVNYSMIKRMPKEAQMYLLKTFNRYWVQCYFPDQWRQTTIIPIPKPNKDHANPVNYRPISLTSCLSKTFERMINKRLIEYLESKKILTTIQCGFRERRSTIDHLVRLESYIRKSVGLDMFTVSVFFDLEKAYDTTWRYGIMKDLYNCGLKGRLPQFIQSFLSERRFKVLVNRSLSREHHQIAGIPQGSILSITLFAMKINSIASIIDRDVHSSLFVDDLQIGYRAVTVNEINLKLQDNINRIANWAEENGFKFSPTKTNCMIFDSKRAAVMKPELQINDSAIPVVETAKFLGLHWDSKLNWVPHMTQLKNSCHKALNLLRTLSSTEWGADQDILMRTYKLIVRPKLDYGSIVYSSGSAAALRSLDAVANEAMRISTGAFKTTPIDSLNIVANEPPLSMRREELTMRYFFRCKYAIQNPSYQSVVNPALEVFFESRPTVIPPLIMRAKDALSRYNITTQPVLPYKTQTAYSWTLNRPSIDLSMKEVFQKRLKNVVPQPYFRELIHNYYSSCVQIYTDGSKCADGVGAAAVIVGERSSSATLPRTASIFSAEVHAISIACTLIEQHQSNNFAICTDSLSSLQGLAHMEPKNHAVKRLQLKIHELLEAGKRISLIWVPSHCNISGNEAADKAARQAAAREPQFIFLHYTDWFQTIREKINLKWREKWDASRRDLHRIKPAPGKWIRQKSNRKEEVVINRLRLGHTRLTHNHLFGDVALPGELCPWCYDAIMTVKHIVIECIGLSIERETIIRRNVRGELTLEKVIGERVPHDMVLRYLRELGIYSEI